MKQIIIFLLLVILGIMGYNIYHKSQRFSLNNYRYKPLESVSATNQNKADLLNYHKAIEALNGYVITQWSAHTIDVRNPKKDNELTKAAVLKYADKLATVKFYETVLLKSLEPKQESNTEKHNRLLKKLLLTSKAMEFGKSSAAVYELQKLLNKKGFKIKIDGYYKSETEKALKEFEKQQGLFPDGKIDVLTLEALFSY